MSIQSNYFSNTISGDLYGLVCGNQLGEGSARTVFECRLNSDLVVKIETKGGSFQNVTEWETWRVWSECKDVAKWLAPCVEISACGTVLLQKRTANILGKLPDKVPFFLTDLKRSNYGKIGNQLVCHDYGNLIPELSSKMKKAEWWA